MNIPKIYTEQDVKNICNQLLNRMLCVERPKVLFAPHSNAVASYIDNVFDDITCGVNLQGKEALALVINQFAKEFAYDNGLDLLSSLDFTLEWIDDNLNKK